MSFGNPQIISSAGTMNVTAEPAPPAPPASASRGSTIQVLRQAPINLADLAYGLALDGITDDGPTLNALMASLNGAEFYLPDRYVLAFATPITIPPATTLRLGAATTLLCNVTGGANAILLDNGGALRGTNFGAAAPGNIGSQVQITAAANVGALVTQVHTDGTQEFAYLEDISLFAANGPAAELLLINGLGINSSFRRIVFRCNARATNALVVRGIAGGGAVGLFDFEGCWFNGSSGHLIIVDASAGGIGPGGLWFTKCAFEGWATGFDAFNLGATNAVYDITVRDCHGERFTADGSATNVFNLIHAVNLKVDAFDLSCDVSGTNVTLVNIGGSASNQGTVLDRLYSTRSITMLNDVKTGNSIAGQNLDSYRQGGTATIGDAPRSVSAPVHGLTAPTYSASITPTAVSGKWQTITVTNATAFTINAPTLTPTTKETQELVIEIFNNSGGVMGAITWNAVFKFNGFVWTNPATGLHRFAKFEWNGANWICTAMAGADY